MADDEITQEETSEPAIETETPESESELEPEDGLVLETDRPAEPEVVSEPEPIEVKAGAEMMSPVEELLPPISVQEFNIVPDFSAFPD